MNIESPRLSFRYDSGTGVERRSTSIETRKIEGVRPKGQRRKVVASKNAFRSGKLTAIHQIYSRCQPRQSGPSPTERI